MDDSQLERRPGMSEQSPQVMPRELKLVEAGDDDGGDHLLLGPRRAGMLMCCALFGRLSETIVA
jgi:hypothetical protein